MNRSPRLAACIGALTWLWAIGCSPDVETTLQTSNGAACASDAQCADGVFCNGTERCVDGGCAPGEPPACDDGVACTADGCSDADGQCTHTPVDAACDDGVFCNGQETCSALSGCQPGTPVDCDDGLLCTVDACDESVKACAHTPMHSACDDGLACNGQETCSEGGPAPTGCIAGPPLACPSDGIACTVDACDEATKGCTHAPTHSLCPAGQVCVVAKGGCTVGAACASDAACQDGDLCNGVEVCVAGACAPGTPLDCDDGIPCTVDACDPGTGKCSHTENDASCSDGIACNGVETCDGMVGCLPGTPVVCDDGVFCTIDSCQEPTGACAHVPNHTACNDGLLCNGLEVCDPTLGCTAGAPHVCPSSSVACVTTACDPALDACTAVPHDEKCPPGQTCDATLGCGNYCQIRKCLGHVYACGDCLDNDGDGLVDAEDPHCTGACDNSEDGFHLALPAFDAPACAQDCYFDPDTGSGNDGCTWDHRCDPLEIAPDYYPESYNGSICAYKPGFMLTPTLSCSQAMTTQSQACIDYCGPLVPNGCDCFGCCEIPVSNTSTTVTVWLGADGGTGAGTCNLSSLMDPTKCPPCTQVGACLNPCEDCELCIGKTTLPSGCPVQACPSGRQRCGLPGQAACPAGSYCVTGCCQPTPT